MQPMRTPSMTELGLATASAAAAEDPRPHIAAAPAIAAVPRNERRLKSRPLSFCMVISSRILEFVSTGVPAMVAFRDTKIIDQEMVPPRRAKHELSSCLGECLVVAKAATPAVNLHLAGVRQRLYAIDFSSLRESAL